MHDTDASRAGGQQVTEHQRCVDDQMEVPATIAQQAGAGATVAGHTGVYVIGPAPLGGAAVVTIQPWLP